MWTPIRFGIGLLCTLQLIDAFTTQIDKLRWNIKVSIDLNQRDRSSLRSPSNDQLVRSRLPHQLSNGRGTFLGFRNTKDVPGLKSNVEALMPDGGLSPCVIRVLGVGGGGCNAVRRDLYSFRFKCIDYRRL